MSPQTAPNPPSAGRQALMWVLKIGVSGGLLYILFSRIDASDVWDRMRAASPFWIAAALAIYTVMLLVSTWRWKLLLETQHVNIRFGALVNSYFAASFANNFLPSNIGGDVIRVADTARPAGSRTLATAVVLADRGVGVVGLAFVAACGSTLAAWRSEALGPVGPALCWVVLIVAVAALILVISRPDRLGALASPLRVFHAEWVGKRIETITRALHRFGQAPGSIAICFFASVVVQALLVAFHVAVATALHLKIPIGHMAMLVPLSFLVLMLPVSLNGFGVREGTFVGYLTAIGVARESALALSLTAAALVMLFSMAGAAAYLTRRQHPAAEPEAP